MNEHSTIDQTGQPIAAAENVDYVLSALTYFGPVGATTDDLENLCGAPFGPDTPLGEALTLAVEQGAVERSGDIFRVACPVSSAFTLVRPDLYRAVADIVRAHQPGIDPHDASRGAALVAHLQRFADDVMTAALGAYAPVVDGDGNLLFVHKSCAYQSWGTGNEPPTRCRVCEMRTDAWAPVYTRSDVTVRRERTPLLRSEPALIAALRGAFSDVDLLDIAIDLNTQGSRASSRLQEIIQDAVEGL